jgi:hypothetical protein
MQDAQQIAVAVAVEIADVPAALIGQRLVDGLLVGLDNFVLSTWIATVSMSCIAPPSPVLPESSLVIVSASWPTKPVVGW